MAIKEITNQKIWDSFVTSQKDYTFLQSWNWGEVAKLSGEKVWRWGIYEKKHLIGVCQAILVSARRGKFLFVPHGPLLAKASERYFSQVLDFLKETAQEAGLSFLRISPWLEASEKNKLLFKKFGFRPAPSLMHAEETWLIGIDKDEGALLGEMRKTTRNLIRRGQKEGVEIIKSRSLEDVKYLYDLQLETAKRSRFVPFSKKLLELEIETFAKDDQCLLFLGRHRQEITAAALIIFYGSFAFYYQSGSQETKVPVNYLLQWEVIKEAKKRGCQVYNMWGIAPENKPHHPWVGLTIFKTGFGGYRRVYLHAQDWVFSSRYWLTYLIERFPKTWRAQWRI